MGVFDKLPGLGGSDEADDAEQSGDSPGSDGEATDAERPADLTPAEFRERAETLAGRSDVPTLDFTVDSLESLDGLASGPSTPVDDEIAYGSYLGETLVRAFDAEWVQTDGWEVAVELTDDRTTVAVFDAATMSITSDPVFSKVAKRLEASGARSASSVDEEPRESGDETPPEPSMRPGDDGDGDRDDDAEADDTAPGDDEGTDSDDTADPTPAPAEPDVAVDEEVPGTDEDEIGAEPAEDERAEVEPAETEDADPERENGETTGPESADAETEGDDSTGDGPVETPVADEREPGAGEATGGEADDSEAAVHETDSEPDDGEAVVDDAEAGDAAVAAGEIATDDQDETAAEEPADDTESEPVVEESAVDVEEVTPGDAAVDETDGDETSTDDALDDDGEPGSETVSGESDAGTEGAEDGDLTDAADDPVGAESATDADPEDGDDTEPPGDTAVDEAPDADEDTAEPPAVGGVVDSDDEVTGTDDSSGAPLHDERGDPQSRDATDEGTTAVSGAEPTGDETRETGDTTDAPAENDSPREDESNGDATETAAESTSEDETTDEVADPGGDATETADASAIEDEDTGDIDGIRSETAEEVDDTGDETDKTADDEDEQPTPPGRSTLREAADALADDWPDRNLDFTPQSLPRLDEFVDDQWEGRFRRASLADRTVDHDDSTDPLTQVGAYYGEVLVRWLDGEWVATDDGEGAVAVPDVGEKLETVPVFTAARECLADRSTFAYRFDALVNRLHVDASSVSDGKPDVYDGDRDELTSADVITQFAATAEELVEAWPNYEFDYSPRSLRRLDTLVAGEYADDRFEDVPLADETDPTSLELTAGATDVGAYFSVVLVRHRDAQWRITDDVELVIDTAEGETTVDPVATAAACLRGERSFASTYRTITE